MAPDAFVQVSRAALFLTRMQIHPMGCVWGADDTRFGRAGVTGGSEGWRCGDGGPADASAARLKPVAGGARARRPRG